MAHPKRRHSHSRKKKKQTHQRLSMPLLVECPECKKLKIAHMVCPFCGYYAGREVVKKEQKDKKDKMQK
ncbi:MAG: 50S ribosomal protein L32 [Candidatus Omnitrophica bacterium]|nr:50S ribosomal protein L32 [Candidatus Omnitrophota bacterium]